MAGHGECIVCGTQLRQQHGFAGTDMCGPCCCGESALIDHISVDCPKHGYDEVHYTAPPCCAARKDLDLYDGTHHKECKRKEVGA